MFDVIEALHEAGCKTWQDYIEVLEDGETLKKLGIYNESTVLDAYHFIMALMGK